MKNISTALIFISIVLFAAQSGFAVIEFKDGGTHNIDYAISQTIWVDYQSPGLQTNVNVVSGGNVGGQLFGYSDSKLNIYGGYAFRPEIYENSELSISGGSFQDVYARDNSLLKISGGTQSGTGMLYTYNNNQTSISGGKLYGLYASNNSSAELSGGSLSFIIAIANTSLTISGGSFNSITANENNRTIIKGSNFAIDGNPVGYSQLTSVYGGTANNEPIRHLTGILENGDTLDASFWIGYTSSITLVPEPGTIGMLALGGVLLRGRKKH
jgi:hypothetical protein